MMNRKGFTLVELMIVVAIIGILAAIAIPNFVNMQYRAKRAELPSNVDGIKTAELAYEASFDQFVDAETAPRGDSDLDKKQVGWSSEAFDTLGWGPDGDVRGNYGVESGDTDFDITGKCDVDGDGNTATYTSSKEENASLSAGDTNTY